MTPAKAAVTAPNSHGGNTRRGPAWSHSPGQSGSDFAVRLVDASYSRKLISKAVDFNSFVQYFPQEDPKGEQYMPPQNIPLWHRIILNWF